MAAALRNAARALGLGSGALLRPAVALPAAQRQLSIDSGSKDLTKDDTVSRFIQILRKSDQRFARNKSTMKGEKTFVTVPDARGNIKTGASAGCLEDGKGRSRVSRYTGEGTGEHVGRSAWKVGLKSVVVKGKGFTSSEKKGTLSWGDGFRGESVRGQSPIMSIDDVMSQLARRPNAQNQKEITCTVLEEQARAVKSMSVRRRTKE